MILARYNGIKKNIVDKLSIDNCISFIEKWENGSKVVWGQRSQSDENAFMYALRTLYYKIIQSFSSIKQYPHVTGFGLYDRTVMDELRKLENTDIMLRNIIPQLGYDIAFVEYRQPLRKSGKSHYNFKSYFELALKSLVYTTKLPLHIITVFGSVASGFFLTVNIINF